MCLDMCGVTSKARCQDMFLKKTSVLTDTSAENLFYYFFLQEMLYKCITTNLVSINYIKPEMMYQIQTQEQAQIKLINQLCILKNKFNKVEKTIGLYDMYSSLQEQEDNVYLHNLHTIAQVLIDNQAQVGIQKVQLDEDVFASKLSIKKSKAKINKTAFEVDIAQQGKPPLLTNIFFYEKEADTSIRVVVIPIQRDLSDISKLKEQQDKLQQENRQKDKQFRENNLTGEQMRAAQAKWNKEKEEKFRKSCQIAKDKHLKMFKIEAFLGTVLQKTETYSLCSLVEATKRRFKNIDYVLNEFSKIFNVPKQQTPQIVLYNISTRNKQDKQYKHQLVTTRFEIDAKTFKVGTIGCWDNKKFFKPQKVRTQIYQNMERSDNKAISKVIQDFVDSWNDITVKTASCITTVVKLVNQKLNKQKNLGTSANTSTDLNTSLTENQNIMSFPKVFQNFIDKSLWFPKGEELGEFYTDERLGKKIKVEKGIAKIPSSIECLVFISFFYKLVSEFSQEYRKKETETRNDQIVLLNLWKSHLRELYELTNSINKTFLDNSQNKEGYKAQDIQRFFDFLMFTLDSSELIKKITGRAIATSTNLKSMFEQFKLRGDRLLSFIIDNENSIKKDEPIQYYQLFLLILKQNASKDIQNDLEYIELHIHEYKAARIATQYIYDNQQLVQAIRSYALICLKYQKLNQNKRKLINIMDIERKLARLLKIIGQEQYAAEIYFKNRQIFFASNCCKQVLSKLKGDQKANILVKWGEKFEKQFEYDLANSYYLMAFSYARTPAQKKRALEHKMNLLEKRTKIPNFDDSSKHSKFIKDEATEESLKEFCSETNLNNIYRKLHKYLEWDSLLERSGFSKLENADVDPDCSVLRSESALQNSMTRQN